jgi:hypothetical protein
MLNYTIKTNICFLNWVLYVKNLITLQHGFKIRIIKGNY